MLSRLRALAEKYSDLERLRRYREEAWAQGRPLGPGELEDRKWEFRRLSAAFPGALRELEITPSAVLAARTLAVARAIAEVERGGQAPLWVRVVLDFHEVLGQVLQAKRWLGTRLGRRGSLTAEIAAQHPTLPPELLAAIRRPAGGRLLPLVWAELERRYGLGRHDLEELVYRTAA